MSQSAQLSLFETEPRKKIGHMPNNYYRALEEDVLQEALEIFRKHSNRYCCPGILSNLAQKHGLGGYWSATVHQLNSQGFFDVMNCYYGSDSPCDKPGNTEATCLTTELRRSTAMTIDDYIPNTAKPIKPHPDDVAVDNFAAAMKEKLAIARGKGRSGWEECSPAELSAMLYEHVQKGDPRDVANLCMFLWNLGRPISPCKEIQAEPFMPVMQFRFEIARLTECLERANSQAEHFEREWYLRGDEIEALKAERNKQAEPVGYIHKDDLKELLSDDARGHDWLTVLFTNPDPDVVALYTHPAPAVAVNERLLRAAKKYFMSYCRDEASEFGVNDTGCSPEQHKDALELGEAIAAAEAAKGGV